METTLIFSEIVYYLTISIVVITLGAFCAAILFYFLKMVQELEGLSHNLKSASSEVGERINDIIERLSALPVFSYLLKKHPKKHEKSIIK